MTVYVDENKNIYMRQGDTGQVEFNGFPTDKTYKVYLAVYDEDKNKILAEVKNVTVTNGEAIVQFTNTFSDSLKVGEWVYGLKLCSGTGVTATEDTLLPRTYVEDGKLIQENAPSFIVYDKVVEGVSEGA